MCSDEEITDFYNDCFNGEADSGASVEACDAFKARSPSCAACILTPQTASHLGPILEFGGLATANVAGCIELTDPGGLMCAKALQAFTGCQLAACEANCPVSDPASGNAFAGCADMVEVTGCASYTTAAEQCQEAVGDAGAGVCFLPSFSAFYTAVVPLFCGQPPDSGEGVPDAGVVSEASTD